MKFQITLWPSLFMLTISLMAIFVIIKPWLMDATKGIFKADPVAATSIVLYLLSFFLIVEGLKVFRKKR